MAELPSGTFIGPHARAYIQSTPVQVGSAGVGPGSLGRA